MEWPYLLAAPMSIARSYLSEINDPLTSATLIWVLCASTKAYATVVYLVLKTIDNYYYSAYNIMLKTDTQNMVHLDTICKLSLNWSCCPQLIVSVHRSLQHQVAMLDMRCYTYSQVSLYWSEEGTRSGGH